MSRSARRVVFWSGVAFFVGGLILCQWSLRVHDRLVNYQRLATMLPLVYALPMLSVDTLANWQNATSLSRIRAIGAIIAAVMLTVGCLAWLVLAPGAA